MFIKSSLINIKILKLIPLLLAALLLNACGGGGGGSAGEVLVIQFLHVMIVVQEIQNIYSWVNMEMGVMA